LKEVCPDRGGVNRAIQEERSITVAVIARKKFI
jgi:hypothetical protein